MRASVRNIVVLGGPSLVLIDRTIGTNIGDMTAAGGLAAAFDGVTSQIGAESAARNGAIDHVGKTYATAKIAARAFIYSSSDGGFAQSINPTDLIIDFYGKNGAAPSSGTDGTLLGTTVPFTDSNGLTKQIESTDLSTAWLHLWVHMRNTAVTSFNPRIAELELYELA